MNAQHLYILEDLAAATIAQARVPPGQCRDGKGPNSTGITIVTPGGHYPAFWIRDFAMAIDCGLIDASSISDHFLLAARCQAPDVEQRLASGAIIPPFAVPDHINLDGTPVFYPGTYSSGEDQGAPPWGPLPPLDDHFYFIHIAWALWRKSRDAEFLSQRILGLTAMERLDRAFAVAASDAVSGAAITDERRRAVGFGFHDTVRLIGELSFVTLLRWQAARELADLHEAVGERAPASEYRKTSDLIADSIAPIFMGTGRDDGWLLAATRVGRQPDVWATLYALHLGVLAGGAAERARRTIAEAVRSPGNSVEHQGAVRHVPSDRWFRSDQCWEAGGTTAGTYQSGAFWHTATGWLIEALQEIDTSLAEEVGERYRSHLLAEDFRKGGGRGAPWECFSLDMKSFQNPVYVTSVAVPLAVLQRGAGCR